MEEIFFPRISISLSHGRGAANPAYPPPVTPPLKLGDVVHPPHTLGNFRSTHTPVSS